MSVDVFAMSQIGQVDAKYVNSDLKPSDVKETPWLYEKDEELCQKFDARGHWGKWMMHLPIGEVDTKWLEARQAYK